eukprot:1155987-Lingulodinium_polyedra.AAC.1
MLVAEAEKIGHETQFTSSSSAPVRKHPELVTAEQGMKGVLSQEVLKLRKKELRRQRRRYRAMVLSWEAEHRKKKKARGARVRELECAGNKTCDRDEWEFELLKHALNKYDAGAVRDMEHEKLLKELKSIAMEDLKKCSSKIID